MDRIKPIVTAFVRSVDSLNPFGYPNRLFWYCDLNQIIRRQRFGWESGVRRVGKFIAFEWIALARFAKVSELIFCRGAIPRDQSPLVSNARPTLNQPIRRPRQIVDTPSWPRDLFRK